jgi:hypothetical protein
VCVELPLGLNRRGNKVQDTASSTKPISSKFEKFIDISNFTEALIETETIVNKRRLRDDVHLECCSGSIIIVLLIHVLYSWV